MAVKNLAEQLSLSALLDVIRDEYLGYELLAHWQQGEFHHDVVVKVNWRGDLPGDHLVIATNCNGGVKEVLCISGLPDRYGLWKRRCPDNTAFEGVAPDILDAARTVHWFDPCELLTPDARSELKVGCRRPAVGGGWEPT